MSLIELANTHKTDKLEHGYLHVYESILSPIKNNNLNFLEIGVYRGESASLWEAYLPNANIFMSDIFDKTEILSRFNVNFFRGDSGNEEDIEKLLDYVESKSGRRNLDVIIDDGSHFQHDQIKGIGNLFPYVTPGGYYIIEDICKEERLRSGSMWWGYSGEPHHAIPGDCHIGSQVRSDKEWLAGESIDYSICTDATIKRFGETKVFSNRFISDEQSQYITDNTANLNYYSNDNLLKCQSKLAVLKKKNQ